MSCNSAVSKCMYDVAWPFSEFEFRKVLRFQSSWHSSIHWHLYIQKKWLTTVVESGTTHFLSQKTIEDRGHTSSPVMPSRMVIESVWKVLWSNIHHTISRLFPSLSHCIFEANYLQNHCFSFAIFKCTHGAAQLLVQHDLWYTCNIKCVENLYNCDVQ